MRRYDDPVEVRKDAEEDPEQFLWRGRLWQVREVVTHWVETGAWWARPAADDAGTTGPSRDQEVWRVTAGRGRVAALTAIGALSRGGESVPDPGYGVFDLVLSRPEGSWQLARATDGGATT